MKRLRKIISFLLCLILTASVFALNAAAIGVGGKFPDVSENAWYYDAVSYCAQEKYITGYGNGKFGPTDSIQRQDFVLILARVAEVNLNNSKYNPSSVVSKFKDVNDSNAYYARALAWGVSEGIVNGYVNGKFGVGDPVTREQICVFIFRYLQSTGEGLVVTSSMRTALSNFKDGGRISSFAVDAVAWCKYKEVVNGTADGYFNPTKTALRCEVAQIIYNACQKHIFGYWMDI